MEPGGLDCGGKPPWLSILSSARFMNYFSKAQSEGFKREKIQPTSGNYHIWNRLIRRHQVNMWSMIIHLLYFSTQGWQRIFEWVPKRQKCQQKTGMRVLELGPQVHFESKKFGSPFFCGFLLVPFLWFRLFLWIKNGRANERTDY